MGIVMEPVDKFFNVFVNNRMKRNIVCPVRQLRRGRKLAVKDEISGFQIIAFFRDLLDGIAAVTQNTLVAIDISDFALAGGGVHETRVVTDQAVIVSNLDLEQIRGSDGAVTNRNLVFFACPVVDNCQCL
jgi:hypothetical protein